MEPVMIIRSYSPSVAMCQCNEIDIFNSRILPYQCEGLPDRGIPQLRRTDHVLENQYGSMVRRIAMKASKCFGLTLALYAGMC